MHFRNMSHRGKPTAGFTLIELIVVVVILVVLAVKLYDFLGYMSWAMPWAYLGQLWFISWHMWSFWLLLAAAIAFGEWQRRNDPDEFVPAEFGLYLVGVFFLTMIACSMSVSGTSGVQDTMWLNGEGDYATYDEAWDEPHDVCDRTDKDGKCVSSHTEWEHHPAVWTTYLYLGEEKASCQISPAQFDSYCTLWGAAKSESNHWGRGRLWTTRYDDTPEKRVPATYQAVCANYVKAARPIRVRRLLELPDKDLVRPYPPITLGTYGPIVAERIVSANVTLPPTWIVEVNSSLNSALSTVGPEKQVNVIVYVANTADENFVTTIDEQWIGGKKNDVVVICGVTHFPAVRFVGVLAWTHGTSFQEKLRERIIGMETVADGKRFASTIIDQIKQPDFAAGYVRVPMREFAHLVRDIKLPWWAHLLTVIVVGVGSFLLTICFRNNKWRNWNPRGRWR